MAMAVVNDGASSFFWLDSWNGFSFSINMPQLFSFAKNKYITVQQMCHASDLHELFHLPSSEEAFQQYAHLLHIIQALDLHNGFDSWTYIWGSHIFTSKKAYVQLTGSRHIHPAFSWLWNSCCQNKRKFFFWLLLKDRLSTRGLLKRKRMALDDYNCVLCNTLVEESLIHLFLDCPFSISSWATLGLIIQNPADPFDTLESFRIQLHKPFFMEIIVTMCWAIWSVRNDAIFRNVQPSISLCKAIFRKEFAQVILRAKRSLAFSLTQWLEAYV
jgi:hypothetical protein